MSKWMSKHHFFDNLSEVLKDLEDISGIGILLNPIHKKFDQNLMSKLAR
jgi:hypothetical protein